jgi:WD40 repeat protein
MTCAVVMVKSLESLLTVGDSTKLCSVLLVDLAKLQPNTLTLLLAMIQDAKRFVLYNRSVIEEAPLQIYASALVFSPTSTIRTLFRDEEPSWIITSPIVGENWNLCLQTLEGHTSSVVSVTFSHDGRQLASSSHDTTVQIWNVETGAL